MNEKLLETEQEDTFKSVPFYNGYYTKTGYPLLCAYGYAAKENRGDDYQYTRTDYPYLRFCFTSREMWTLLHLTTDMKILINCTEGKDRTGFVCLVLESLCAASYEEMLHDYMVTYDNYYGLTEASDKDTYDYIVENKFNDMINYLLTFDGSTLQAKGDGSYDLAAVTTDNYAAAAENLLSDAGLTEENLQALTALLKKN